MKSWLTHLYPRFTEWKYGSTLYCMRLQILFRPGIPRHHDHHPESDKKQATRNSPMHPYPRQSVPRGFRLCSPLVHDSIKPVDGARDVLNLNPHGSDISPPPLTLCFCRLL
jgi:hypothetical protein